MSLKKTKTLIALLNVIHMKEYQEYYEALLASTEPVKAPEPVKQTPDAPVSVKNIATLASQGTLLETMMAAVHRTTSSCLKGPEQKPLQRLNRPRLLICAPLNSAVDEILTRLIKIRFFDGQGRTYCPELARIGAGDKVSESVKMYTAEGQAERFLDNLWLLTCPPIAQKTAQQKYLQAWQVGCNSLLKKLATT